MNDIQFDFIADRKKNTLTIKREFNTGRQLGWDCYTKQDLLDGKDDKGKTVFN